MRRTRVSRTKGIKIRGSRTRGIRIRGSRFRGRTTRGSETRGSRARGNRDVWEGGYRSIRVGRGIDYTRGRGVSRVTGGGKEAREVRELSLIHI